MKASYPLGFVVSVSLLVGCGGDDSASTTGFKQNPAGGGGSAGGSSGPSVGGGGSGPSAGGGACEVFPKDNWWNEDISNAPLDPNSSAYVAFISQNGGDGPLHADFDSLGDGIPFQYADGSVTKQSVSFTYADESDKGPYPIPNNPKIEGGSDHHVLVVDNSECKLYELWEADHSSGMWHAGSGAIFDLKTGELRKDCWTSADAAGLPIFPGLVRFDEVTKGEIDHALRFTVDTSQMAWIKPARHQASSNTSTDAPPMGLRFRLKSSASVNALIAKAGPQPKVVLVALQKYGMFVADNGSNWFVSGEPNKKWNDDDFHASFDELHGEDFEVVDTGEKIEHQSMCH